MPLSVLRINLLILSSSKRQKRLVTVTPLSKSLRQAVRSRTYTIGLNRWNSNVTAVCSFALVNRTETKGVLYTSDEIAAAEGLLQLRGIRRANVPDKSLAQGADDTTMHNNNNTTTCIKS